MTRAVWWAMFDDTYRILQRAADRRRLLGDECALLGGRLTSPYRPDQLPEDTHENKTEEMEMENENVSAASHLFRGGKVVIFRLFGPAFPHF